MNMPSRLAARALFTLWLILCAGARPAWWSRKAKMKPERIVLILSVAINIGLLACIAIIDRAAIRQIRQLQEQLHQRP
jgi:hypothetical protein